MEGKLKIPALVQWLFEHSFQLELGY